MPKRDYNDKHVQEMNMEDLINTVSDDLSRYDKLKTLEGVKKEMSVGLFSNNLSERGLKAYIRLLELELQLATTREPIFHDSRGFGEYLAGKYASLDHEEMHLISLSNKGQIISDDVVGSGTLEKSAVSIPLIIKTLCLNGAANFIVVHNHPSGSMKPSKADLTMTESIYSLSKLIKVHMLDHFIIGNGNYFSFAEHDLLGD